MINHSINYRLFRIFDCLKRFIKNNKKYMFGVFVFIVLYSYMRYYLDLQYETRYFLANSIKKERMHYSMYNEYFEKNSHKQMDCLFKKLQNFENTDVVTKFKQYFVDIVTKLRVESNKCDITKISQHILNVNISIIAQNDVDIIKFLQKLDKKCIFAIKNIKMELLNSKISAIIDLEVFV